MSAYSDWKYGLISDSEYNSICRAEDVRDGYRPANHVWEEDLWNEWAEEEDEYDIYFD